MSERSGVLITLEGCDGCGKSTQAALLCERLAACGLPVGPAVAPGTVVREPGGTAAGEAIRDVLLHGPEALAPWTEALLYAAARAELVERVLLPELARRARPRPRPLHRLVARLSGLRPRARRRCGAGRQRARACAACCPTSRSSSTSIRVVGLARAGGAPDRIEAEGLDFQQRVAAGFAVLARRFPERVRLIDGFRDVDLVAADVEAAALEAVADAGLRLGG